MKFTKKSRFNRNNAGFLIADFLFAFTMVIGIGIFMFALTFSLATIEVGQYIVWSTARNYSSGQYNAVKAKDRAYSKFEKLTAQFPLLTNSDGNSSWFELSREDLKIGELEEDDPTFKINTDDKKNNFRQPWTGASTTINLKLFSNLQVPFLGKVTSNKSIFTFPVRAFLIRNVSVAECNDFFNQYRYSQGMKNLENGKLAPAAWGPINNTCVSGRCGEDQGC